MDLLNPDEAAQYAGVPAVQLSRWAFLGQGPKNSGTKWKPLYAEDDIAAWRYANSDPGERLEAAAVPDARMVGLGTGD
jgi:hypothetical protein